MSDLLRVENITVRYSEAEAPAVRDVSFSLEKGRVLGIVGESGCGKSTLIKAVMNILPSGVQRCGRVLFNGEDIYQAQGARRRSLLGNEMGIIIQDSISSLNPIRRVRTQFIELYREKLGWSKEAALTEAERLLTGMHCTKDVLDRYPFQLSGGQRQRVMIAMAFALKPSLLIADEPTTALDVTVQAEILREIMQMKEASETGVIFISHNLGVIAQVADEIAVMYRGQVVEYGSRESVLEHSEHPYTQELIRCIPRVSRERRERLHSIGNTGIEGSVSGNGCAFANRCPECHEQCRDILPDCHYKEEGIGYTRCHLLNTKM